MNHRVGLHLRITNSLVQLADFAHQKGLSVLQTFFMTDDGFVLKIPAADRVCFSQQWKDKFAHVFLHCSYRINFSSCTYQEHPVFERELQLAKRCGITQLVIHPGSIDAGFDRLQALQSLARFLNSICAREKNITIILENSVGKAQTVGAHFTDFVQLHPFLEFPNRIGICVDTAHAHVSGYDLTTQQGYEDLCNAVAQVVQLFSIKLLHLNNTPQKAGSLYDHHALPLDGVIPEAVLKKLVLHDLFKTVPIVIEPPVKESLEAACAAVDHVKKW